ncbi:hypothetical protein BGZ49_001027 [Haplosporangium sp. Z 27]|nr:hypothetical protein BGZ49_001027 [Haplosporangium sp. Z 27]
MIPEDIMNQVRDGNFKTGSNSSKRLNHEGDASARISKAFEKYASNGSKYLDAKNQLEYYLDELFSPEHSVNKSVSVLLTIHCHQEEEGWGGGAKEPGNSFKII